MIENKEKFFDELFEELENYIPTDDEVWDEETRENWNAKMESVK